MLYLALAVFCSATLWSQRGDLQGEIQKSLPGHIVVPPAPIRTAQEELATFSVAPGYRIDLVATDPLVGDPVAAQFGPDGRMWVVEMRGFMPNIEGTGEREPVGRIAVLTDTDADGRFDHRVDFAQGLVMPRALLLVGDGLLVAEPPKLWFFRDTDGDGIADEKKEVADDYGDVTNPEHGANGLMWAMDNWIYSARHNVRFRYEGNGRFISEPTVARGHWGLTQDEMGRFYFNTNADPLRREAIPSHYLDRNPSFVSPAANVPVVPRNLRIWPGRVTPGVNRGYKILGDEGRITAVTAACGPVLYRGDLFPADAYGDAFVPEPAGNLIKRIKLVAREGAVTGANVYNGTEFITSTDERFRPVSIYNGPDGSLYVVDFYRGILQHGIYITTFLRKQIEERKLDQGRGLGRVWRITAQDAPPAKFDVGLARASVDQLVGCLNSPQGWQRDTAQRLLVERRAPGSIAPLRALVDNPKSTPLARIHALWTLDGIGGNALTPETIATALADPDARLIAAAVRLSERFIKEVGEAGALLSQVIALVEARHEPDLRLQLALTLGESKTPAAERALRDLSVVAGRQPFLADAIVSGLADREDRFVVELLRHPKASEQGQVVLRYLVSAILKSGDAARIESTLALIGSDRTPTWARTTMLAGVRHFLPKAPDGKSFAGTLPKEPTSLITLANNQEFAGAAGVRELLSQLNWPGKPGLAASIRRPFTKAEQASFDRGRTVFATHCVACHQTNGQGLAGMAPSLIHSKWVIGDPGVLSHIVLNGKMKENLVMPPWKTALDDTAVASVLTFIRGAWGNEASPVASAEVADVRQKIGSRDEPYTDPELLKLEMDRSVRK